jgi:hypothetical protein
MNSFSIKILALILMVLDHISYFFSDIPIYFRWLGRLSAPLFIFCMVWGFHYTKDKKIYLARMYLFSLGMAIINVVLSNLFRASYPYGLSNNIFTTLFLIAVMLYLIIKSNKKYWFILFIWQIFTFIAIVVLAELINIPYISYHQFYGSLLASVFFTEGGLLFVLLGTIIYLSKDNMYKLSISYIIFCIFIGLSSVKFDIARSYIEIHFGPSFLSDLLVALLKCIIVYDIDQWIMVFALPFMLLYNHKKGLGWKYFFYVFYPLHIIIIFLISMACLPV